jgi:uncharacterized protein with HEPN domain
MRDDRLCLEDIREAVSQIEKYTGRGRLAFENDELIRVWVLHHLEIIGEACRGWSEEFRRTHANDIWSDAISFRNVLVHQYFGIDLEAVWNVVVKDIPTLKVTVQQALERWAIFPPIASVTVETVSPAPSAGFAVQPSVVPTPNRY